MTSPITTAARAATSTAEFPADFLWGTATAAYQIEGAVAEDGRSPSIWDTFSHTPGAVLGGDAGDLACDHYHRMPADVALMKELGMGAYRFSVAWPRIRPDGGPVNARGLDFYARLVDELLGAGITPWLTLYHWDLPQHLEDAGGWTNRDTALRFVEYAMSVYDGLGDRVPFWTTLNEPWCSAFLGYTGGQHAPGRREGAAGLVAAHHLLLGHGLVIDELRRRRTTAKLGITLNFSDVEPFDPHDPGDIDAARRVDATFNRVFLDPLFRGGYAADLLDDTAHLTYAGREWTGVIRPGDLDLIAQPLDVLGVNYYRREAVSAHPHADLSGSRIDHPSRPTSSPYPGSEFVTQPRRPGAPVTGMDWDVAPDGLTRLLLRLADDYAAPPLYITENGAAYDDEVTPDAAIHDPERTAYYAAHLRAVHDAMTQGADVRGYFAWSLLDNFEWAYGYRHRFGLVHVDFDTQKRTPKDSAWFYARVAATGKLERTGEDADDEGAP
ncbi:MAG: GH1 family beta-glucosidase [Nocardioides sp.]|uniref:GH1 family beta-glucosidase n=1 Tax=Nocardioides sp. TaxID=35761 RepID=UPI0039E27F69